MCTTASADVDVSVIVPTPWVPPLVPFEGVSRFRRVPGQERRGSVDVHFPRVPGSIDLHTHGVDARLAAANVRALAHRLHRERPFDLIHAHFIYPDGVLASRIGQDLGAPVMTTEHSFWTPWLIDRPRVGAQVDAALDGLRLVAPVSRFLQEDVDRYLSGRVETRVLPNVVDDAVFTTGIETRDPDELLYVGLIRRFKRVDVLLRAFAEAREHLPTLRLRILSANALRAYSTDRKEMLALVTSLGLEDVVRIEHGADPPAVAAAMRRCGFVVVSSTRLETFCSVAAEALACGTPLVITRCGGPEEFVTPEDGVMVPADDPTALTAGILRARAERGRFQPEALRRRIVGRFGREAWREQLRAVYEHVAMSGGR
jgi:glycosyltransferase involved in cell wall biosynthesis